MYYKAHYYNALLEYVAGNLFLKSHHFDLPQIVWEVLSQITIETTHSFGFEKNPDYTYSTQTIA